MWLLWLLSQPTEKGAPGFDPITARKLTIEAAIFYLTSEDDMKRRCVAENKRSEKAGTKTKSELLAERMLELRLKYAGSAEL